MFDINVSEMSDEDLEALAVKVEGLNSRINSEKIRRHELAILPELADKISKQWTILTGREDGDEWQQPTGAHDAYTPESIVSRGGKLWVSLTPANVWEPGVSGWREIVDEDSGPAEWVAPTGAHDAYKIGDRVTFNGMVYESLIAGNTWSPSAYPAGWKLIQA